MYGCNFTCPKFGIARDVDAPVNEEVVNIVRETTEIFPEKYNSIDKLPLARTGCDSYAAWHPAFKHLQTDTNVDGLVDVLLDLTPTGCWTLDNGQDIHLVITGGEPLLGWQRVYIELFNHPKMKDLKNVTFETNTTQLLSTNFKRFLGLHKRLHITFSCSPKLSISGHSWDDAILPKVALDYFTVTNSQLYFKFVVCDAMDMVEVDKAVDEYKRAGIEAPVYVMAVGGTSHSYFKNAKQVAELAMEKGYRYSPRLHVDLFGNQWGT
jgi:organic radical activating enzyme